MRRKQLRFIVYVAEEFGTIGPDESKKEHSSSRKERITHLTRTLAGWNLREILIKYERILKINSQGIPARTSREPSPSRIKIQCQDEGRYHIHLLATPFLLSPPSGRLVTFFAFSRSYHFFNSKPYGLTNELGP